MEASKSVTGAEPAAETGTEPNLVGVADDGDRWIRPVDPSRLLVWVGRWTPPSSECLARVFGEATVEAIPMPEPVRWAVAVHSAQPGRPTCLLWAEQADPAAVSGGPVGTADAEVVVGIETLLPAPEAGDPWAAWLEMARALDSIGADGPMLDPLTGRWFDRELLEAWFTEADSPEAPGLPDELLWSVRAARREGGRGVWLTTEGLARIGRPELEMLEAPEELADVAAALLDGLAGLSCECPAPRRRAWTIGPDLVVSAQSPEEVLETTHETSAGARGRRGGRASSAPGDTTGSVVVCGGEPRGSYRRVWTSPIETLEAVSRGAAIHRSDRAATRQRRLAQHRLDLVDASLQRAGDSRVLIAGGGSSNASVWGVVVQALGDRWAVQPLDLAGRPAVGEPETLIARQDVVDWRIEIDGVVHGPEEAGLLADLLQSDGVPGSGP